MDLTPGTVIAGKFRLDRPLAQGGMGSVWVAFNTQLEVPVALKFMAPSLVGSAELVTRFEREAKAAAQLRNPHVVQVFEHGVDRGTPFIAMELLEGEDLGSRLRTRGRLSLPETARIAADVCKALRRAHDMGLVHRDLKPANIFLCKHDDDEVIKVLDFGIAKSIAASTQDEATKTGALVGSPHYMSPEQARRTIRQVDHRADLWALGVITFRCLTGRLPFPGDDVIDVLVRVCTDPVPTPSSIAPDLGHEIDRFFARALARDPDQRFQSAREMADALARLAGPASRDSLPALNRSWSDVRPPPPRVAFNLPPLSTSDPGPARAAQPVPPPPGAAITTDDLDNAATLPIAHPNAQRAIAGQAWAAAVLPPGSTPFPPAPEPTAPLPPAPPPPTPGFAPAWSAERPPIASPPGLFAPTHTTTQAQQDAGAAPPLVPQSGGTITSAGTELAAMPSPAKDLQDRSWIVVAAAAAAIVVVGILVGTVLLARGTGEGVADSEGGDTKSEPAVSPPKSMGTPESTTATAPSTPEPPPTSTATETGSADTPTAPPSTAEPSASNSSDSPAPPATGNAMSKEPSSTAKPTDGTPTGRSNTPRKPTSGYLQPPDF